MSLSGWSETSRGRALALALVYTASYLFLLLNVDGLYWDDWIIHGLSVEAMRVQYDDGGNIGPLGGYVNELLLPIGNGVWPFRVVTFVIHGLAGACLYSALRAVKEIGAGTRTWITAVFLVFPVNEARIATAMLPFNLCYASFFGAVWAYGRYCDAGKRSHRIVGAALLFFSYHTVSHIPFTLALAFYLAYRIRAPIHARGVLAVARRFPELGLLPFVFMAYRSVAIPRVGHYERYNRLRVDRVLDGIPGTFETFGTSLFPELATSMGQGIWMAATALVLFFVMPSLGERERLRTRTVMVGLVASLLVYLAASFPYAVVNKVPRSLEFTSRWQMLLPLGTAGMLILPLAWVASRSRRWAMVALAAGSCMLGGFVVTNARTMIQLRRDWYKQEAIRQALAESELTAREGVFLFDDLDAEDDALGRHYRFFEYSVMLDEIYGGQTRLGCDRTKYEGVEYYCRRFAGLEMFRVASLDPNAIEVANIRIEPGDRLTDAEVLALTLRRLGTTRAQIASEVRSMVRVTVAPVAPQAQPLGS